MKHEITAHCYCKKCKLKFESVQSTKKTINSSCPKCKKKADLRTVIQTITVTKQEWKNSDPVYIPSHPRVYEESIYEGNETHNEKYLKFLQKKHFCMADSWDLYTAIARFIVPRLREMIDLPTVGHPTDITYEEWTSYLNKMLFAMETLATDEDDYSNKEQQDKITEGLDLFHKYFRSLWD